MKSEKIIFTIFHYEERSKLFKAKCVSVKQLIHSVTLQQLKWMWYCFKTVKWRSNTRKSFTFMAMIVNEIFTKIKFHL